METQTDFKQGPNAYVTDRDNLIAEIINLCHIVYPGDREMVGIVIDLTTDLMIAESNRKFIDGIRGFMSYADLSQSISASSALTTIIHDLGEFSRNRHEGWFSPRTARYDKYLTGAAG